MDSSYHVPTTDPDGLKMDSMVAEGMMESQDPTLAQNGNTLMSTHLYFFFFF